MPALVSPDALAAPGAFLHGISGQIGGEGEHSAMVFVEVWMLPALFPWDGELLPHSTGVSGLSLW